MRLTKNVLLVTFALFWAVVSAHCKLESIPGLDFLKCDSAETPSSHCAGDSCDGVEDGQFFQVQKAPGASFVSVALPFNMLLPFEPANHLTNSPIPKVLPELPVSWQFISRTALPVRAPSFVS